MEAKSDGPNSSQCSEIKEAQAEESLWAYTIVIFVGQLLIYFMLPPTPRQPSKCERSWRHRVERREETRSDRRGLAVRIGEPLSSTPTPTSRPVKRIAHQCRPFILLSLLSMLKSMYLANPFEESVTDGVGKIVAEGKFLRCGKILHAPFRGSGGENESMAG